LDILVTEYTEYVYEFGISQGCDPSQARDGCCIIPCTEVTPKALKLNLTAISQIGVVLSKCINPINLLETGFLKYFLVCINKKMESRCRFSHQNSLERERERKKKDYGL
jgi:hypothetical protein